jgi:hypothetical protein
MSSLLDRSKPPHVWLLFIEIVEIVVNLSFVDNHDREFLKTFKKILTNIDNCDIIITVIRRIS